jgi:two-component system chemotaxis sensor kinase CheA
MAEQHTPRSAEEQELIEIRNEFIEESLEGLSNAANDVVAFESSPGNTGLVDRVFRTAHSIKGNAAFFGLLTLKNLAHRIEDVLGAMKRREIPPTRSVTEAALAGFDELSSMLSRVRDGGPEIRDPHSIERLIERLEAALQTEPASASGSSGESAPAKEEATRSAAKTMRVREESIDGFFRYVGELVVVEEMYGNVHEQLVRGVDPRLAATELRRAIEAFHVLSQEMQRSILEIRKVAASTLLRRVPRLARDVAGSLAKEISLQIEGEAVLIDKSIAEALEAPLVHMVRNAVDHGVETPSVRSSRGKPSAGRLRVCIAATSSDIVLTVEDDGQGIDHDKLLRKAVAQGLVAEGQPLSSEAIVALLFRPGVSTAETVTDVSGRGVGMDVVKKNIDSLGGCIEVHSQPGQGTRFTVTVPASISTKIIQGVGVIVEGERFILPMDSIVRFLQVDPARVSTLESRGAAIQVDGQTVTLARLKDMLNGTPIAQGKTALASGPLVLVHSGHRRMALGVDAVEACRQVVLKPLDDLPYDTQLFRGAALMGDGTVALVVDCDKLDTIAPRP